MPFPAQFRSCSWTVKARNAGHSTWRHILDRDKWHRPEGVGDDQDFLMVQVMETWFLADRAALQEYFGAKFKEKAFKI